MADEASNSSHASPQLPSLTSGLSPRFEIRRLEERHIPWAGAMVVHSNLFYSPLWSVLYPEQGVSKSIAGYAAIEYLIRHQITSGMSFGVFDKEYQFKRPESEKDGGKCYWDTYSEDAEPTKDEMLEAMDFPLVSVALAYDAISPLDHDKLAPLLEVLPEFGTVYGVFHDLDKRDPSSWEATGPKQVLMRNATATRHDYEGQRLMGTLARQLMTEAKKEGYRGINIECLADAVAYVWSQPPKPFTADIVCQFELFDWSEVDPETGEQTYPFRPAKQTATRVYTRLE